MAALLSLRADIDDRLFTFEIELVALEREPANTNDALLIALIVLSGLGQRPIQVDPFVLSEIWIQRDAEHAVLQTGEGRHLSDLDASFAGGHHSHHAIALRIKHRAIRRHRQLHRILQCIDEFIVLLVIAIQDDLTEITGLLRAAGFGLRHKIPSHHQASQQANSLGSHD